MKTIISLILLSLSFSAFAFPKATIQTFDGEQKISILSESEAATLFEDMAALKRVPFKYFRDGCWARAQRMTYRMSLLKIRAGKLFIVGKLRPRQNLGWRYHVAPFILVGTLEKFEVRIIDPALFDRPVTEKEWVDASHPVSYKLYYRSRGAFYHNDEYRPHISLGERIETGATLRKYRRMLK